MKVRTDFVTNSSSSSFILGKPDGTTETIKSAKKYLKDACRKVSSSDRVGVDHIIDLRYDPEKEYRVDDIQFVIEAIVWYSDPEYNPSCVIGWDDDDGAYLVAEDGSIIYLDCYHESFTPVQVKAIFDYAYHNYGEILVGNSEIGFSPSEMFYDVIAEDAAIKYSCNHMG